MASKHDLAEQAYQAALAEVPHCRLPAQRFRAFVDCDGVSADALVEFGFELFIACACGSGDEGAIDLLERRYLTRVEDFLGRFRLSADQLREHHQLLRIRLLVGPSPGILRYRGVGPLGAWLRMTSTRLALNLLHASAQGQHLRADSGIWERLSADTPSPELGAARAEHREVFAAALERGLSALVPRDRTLLRMHLLDGLNIDAISTIYRVHRSTVARRLIAVRDKVYESMRKSLPLELRTTTGELRSLVQLLRKDIQLSLDRILRSGQSI